MTKQKVLNLCRKKLQTSVDILHLLYPQHTAVWSAQLFARYDLQQLGE